ncbi:ATP-grasp domain-containing protein [Solwaraspora sp. WMMD1047]|uniref:ATP-grasp domain-containing protein n=1 Tax=Solwaraspora sp. WMMD1047 TaxID=3016102 RepID=UPI0024166888|nr:ATP-grasp domain-containing protein [Solwaraspora sp. WMMD1047]MDG4834253.1 ATP-grasp domain-containing protein [Solwaraspora sp. WMMD1047]
MVGFGAGILPALNAVLPPGSLTIVEDPHVARVRQVRERMAAFPCVAELVELPVQDEDRVTEQVSRWPLPAGVTAVLPGLEYGVVGAAALAAHLGLPGAGVPAARLLRDKIELRTAAGAELAQPRWREVSSASDVLAFPAPSCVLKPANRQASLGVQLLGPGDDRAEAWRHTVGVEEPLMRAPGGPPPRYLVEERLHGPEVSAEALVQETALVFLNITAKTVLPGRYPVELGHLVPAPVDERIEKWICAAMRDLIAATGFVSGALHAEWILVDDQPHLVECAGRLPGDEIVPLIDLAYGGNLVADLVAVLSGRTPVRPDRAERGAAVRFLTAEPGLVTTVQGAEAARAVPGVVDLRLTTAPGDQVGALESSWDRLGRVLATGSDADGAAHAAAAATEKLTIRTTTTRVRVLTDPRSTVRSWARRPADPRDDWRWAAGVSDDVAFLVPDGGPALWLRGPDGVSARMDPVAVAGGAPAGRQPPAQLVGAARDAHPRFLVSSATGYGSPLTSASATATDLDTLVAALLREAKQNDATPAVLHCPAGDPLLPALVAAGFTLGVTDLYPTIELPGNGPADYLEALPKGHRDNARREIRLRGGGPAHVYLGEQARPHLATAAALSASAYRQRGEHSDDTRAIPIYGRLLDRWGDDFVLTLVEDEAGPVASAVLVVGATELLLYSAGLHLPRARAVAGYFNAAYYLPVELAYQRRLRRIRLGPTGWDTKRLRGARFTPMYSAVPTKAGALVDLLAATDQWTRAELQRLDG